MIENLRILAILVFPLYLVFFLIGWGLYFAGLKMVRRKMTDVPDGRASEAIRFGVLSREEQLIRA
jgi:uncharacterized protein YneF (UPF0154 family)